MRPRSAPCLTLGNLLSWRYWPRQQSPDRHSADKRGASAPPAGCIDQKSKIGPLRVLHSPRQRTIVLVASTMSGLLFGMHTRRINSAWQDVHHVTFPIVDRRTLFFCFRIQFNGNIAHLFRAPILARNESNKHPLDQGASGTS